MTRVSRRSWAALARVGAVLAAVAWSLVARAPSDPTSPEPTPAPSLGTEPVAILVDLVDDVSAGERARVARALREAMAPAPSDDDVLGPALSAPAELYRLEAVPPSEVRDVLALAAAASVEGVEVEGLHRVPPVPAAAAMPGDAVDPQRPAPRRPNDPYYKHQWHLDQIQMPEAWPLAEGDGVVVAVIDTGVSLRDREADGWIGAPDLAGTGSVEGWDFVDNDDQPDDLHGHGTHVAGTIAQTTNNGVGVAGVAPKARIMPIRVLDARGAGRFGNVAAGIRWATDHGAQVINMSLGGPLPSLAVRRAVQHARRQGVFVVAAAGNAGSTRVGFPAGHDGAFAVGSVRFDRTLAFYSNHGTGLDIVAPGGDTRVDQNGDGLPDGVLQNVPVGPDKQRYDYVPFMGTSMAAPHVAGVAALLLGTGAMDDPDAVSALLSRTADDLGGDRHRFGAGLIQARDALVAAHRGRGILGALLVLVLAALANGGRRRNGSLPALILGLGLAGAASAVVPALPVGLGALAAAAAPGPVASDLAVLVVLGAWVPLGVHALFGGLRAGQTLVVGVATGVGALCLGEALWPVLQLGPASLDAWVGPWLLVQAAGCLGVARLVLTPR